MNVSLFQSDDGAEPRIQVFENGGSFYTEGLNVFKAGTFKDSWGVQHTWEPEHLEQMVFHFAMLRNRGLFENVPFRVDHTRSAATVVGYFESLSVEDNFLRGRIKWTEPDAVEKINRGTYRSRSAEIGMYETNDEAMFWPVFMGCAFVDIPAVEGLYSNANRKYTFLSDKEFAMQTDPNGGNGGNGGGGGGGTPAPEPTPPTPPTPDPSPTPSPGGGDGGDGGDGGGTNGGTNPPSASHTAPTATFRVNGQATTDFAAVQSHIDGLETFRTETLNAARRNFVAELARTNRIAATQVESLTNHALGLSDAQWDGFRASYENAPTVGLLGQFGAGNPNPDGDPPAAASERETLEGILAMHKRAGMSEDDIQKTSSFKKLAALNSLNGN